MRKLVRYLGWGFGGIYGNFILKRPGWLILAWCALGLYLSWQAWAMAGWLGGTWHIGAWFVGFPALVCLVESRDSE